MAKNRSNDYYGMFLEVGEIACQITTALQRTLEDYNPKIISATMKELHQLEQSADEKTHVLLEKLAKEFIAPIEREDIIALSNHLDDVVDAIEDVLIKVYMFHVNSIRPDALKMLNILSSCCGALLLILKEFHNFKKSDTIKQHIIEVNRLEEEGDDTYIHAVRELYKDNSDPVEKMAWTSIYGQLEKCCDACEHAADIVQEIIMKNS